MCSFANSHPVIQSGLSRRNPGCRTQKCPGFFSGVTRSVADPKGKFIGRSHRTDSLDWRRSSWLRRFANLFFAGAGPEDGSIGLSNLSIEESRLVPVHCGARKPLYIHLTSSHHFSSQPRGKLDKTKRQLGFKRLNPVWFGLEVEPAVRSISSSFSFSYRVDLRRPVVIFAQSPRESLPFFNAFHHNNFWRFLAQAKLWTRPKTCGYNMILVQQQFWRCLLKPKHKPTNYRKKLSKKRSERYPVKNGTDGASCSATGPNSPQDRKTKKSMEGRWVKHVKTYNMFL